MPADTRPPYLVRPALRDFEVRYRGFRMRRAEIIMPEVRIHQCAAEAGWSFRQSRPLHALGPIDLSPGWPLLMASLSPGARRELAALRRGIRDTNREYRAEMARRGLELLP